MNIANTSDLTEESIEELELCISCLGANSPGTTFCRHCGTPLTSYAATGPLESLYAEGDFWRKAVAQAKNHPLRQNAISLFLVFMVLAFLLGALSPR
jgi:predicted amidophosphoribosyltransferase